MTLKELEKKINNLANIVESGFEKVNEKVDTQFKLVNEKVDTQFKLVNEKVDTQFKLVNTRLDNIESRLDNVEKDVALIKNCPTIQKELSKQNNL